MDAAGASASLLAAARAAAASRASGVRDSDTTPGSTPRSLSRGILADSPRSRGRNLSADGSASPAFGVTGRLGVSRSGSVASSASFDVATVGTPRATGSVEERAEAAMLAVSTPRSSAVVHSVPPGPSQAASGSGNSDGGVTAGSEQSASETSAGQNGGQRRMGGWRSLFRAFGVGGNGNNRVSGRRDSGEGDPTP